MDTRHLRYLGGPCFKITLVFTKYEIRYTIYDLRLERPNRPHIRSVIFIRAVCHAGIETL
jgi:hypothetical protein